MPTTPTVASARDDILPMTVGHMAFLVDNLYKDCSPLQFPRQLTRNSIQSIQRLWNPAGGKFAGISTGIDLI